MCDTSPYCPNDNLERRHSTCVKHKLNIKDSFSHTTISITSTVSTKYHKIYNTVMPTVSYTETMNAMHQNLNTVCNILPPGWCLWVPDIYFV